MPSQTVELPKTEVAAESAPSITTDAPHERAWFPPYLAPAK
ncbi:hypothetical protein [Kitasatospora terrestris]|uniref:Uncharacterized protein n=1 Tax=Kitasatospora terrestris TaxID=258051 RepID=A0ABP9E2Q4_9ACTN